MRVDEILPKIQRGFYKKRLKKRKRRKTGLST